MRRSLLVIALSATVLGVPTLAGTTSPVSPRAATADAAAKRPAVVRTGRVINLAPRSATLTGSVKPRSKTRYRFQFGLGTKLNRLTRRVTLAAGTVTVPVSAAIATRPNARYSYRLVAENAGGTARGKVRTFTSPREAAALSFDVASSRVPYEGTAVFGGIATSAGAGDVPLVLQGQPFPYSGAFAPIATTRSAADGSYRFSLSPLPVSARYRVVAQTSPPTTSVTRTVRTTVRVGLRVTRLRGGRVRFSGDIAPALSEGRVSLQRRVRGRFVTQRRASIRHPDPGRASYRVTVGARRTSTVYRVLVTPTESSGHARGSSRERRIAGRR